MLHCDVVYYKNIISQGVNVLVSKFSKFIALSLVISSQLVFSNSSVSAVTDNNNDTFVSLGVSLSEDQKKETLLLLGADEVANDKIFNIDGQKLNDYLNDGSTTDTTIYSSSKVEFKNEGYGVQVKINTPNNITNVTQSTYVNAAIAAGATNVDIQIASISQVTGEGALAGVYEIFTQSGQALSFADIQNAEKQIKIEQLLLEESNLSKNKISRLITEINLAIATELESKDQLSNQEVSELINRILSENQIDLTENASNLLLDHGIYFSQSDVAKDIETKNALTEVLSKHIEMDTLFSKSIVAGDSTFKIDNIEIIPSTESENYSGKDLLGITYTVTLDENAQPDNAEVTWMRKVEVIQDNNPDIVNSLMFGFYFMEEFADAQIQNIKPGGSNQYMISYELSDFVTPIEITFYEDLWSSDKIADQYTIEISHLVNQ